MKEEALSSNNLTWDEFSKVEIRIGTIIESEVFKEARIPAIKLKIDFGEFGIKNSSAQITDYYNPESIIGRQIVAVINFPPKQIARFMSECLVLGVIGEQSDIILLAPDQKVKNGLRIG